MTTESHSTYKKMLTGYEVRFVLYQKRNQIRHVFRLAQVTHCRVRSFLESHATEKNASISNVDDKLLHQQHPGSASQVLQKT